MSTKKLSLLALFIALSVIGASIKIPAIVGSVALDAFPALLASILLGKYQGAIIAGFGHMVSALLTGMILGPMHVIIAVEMAIMVWCFSVIYQSGKKKSAGIFFILSNSILAPLPMIFLFSEEFYYALLPSLFIGATLNTILALVLIPKFKTIFSERLVGNL